MMERRRTFGVGMATAVWLVLVGGLGSPVRAAAESFHWYGELLSIHRAEKTLTMRALARENVPTFLNMTDTRPGASLVVIWEALKGASTDAPNVLAVATPKQMAAVRHGYLTPVEYVAVDAVAHTFTFKVRVSDAVLRVAESLPPGRWLKVTAPMASTGADVVLVAASPAEMPELKPRTPTPVPAAASPSRPVVAAVEANGGISGPWELRYKTPLATTTYMACDLAQDGPLVGGACRMPGVPQEMPVAGHADGTHFELQIPAGGTVYTGELDTAATTIRGTVESMGAEVDFQLTRGTQ